MDAPVVECTKCADRAAELEALRHRVRELEEAMRLCGIDHSSLIRIATAIRGSAP